MSANYQLLHSKWYKIRVNYLKIPFIQKPAMILKCSSLNSLPRVHCLTKFHQIDNRKIKYKLLTCIFVKNKQQNILKKNFPIPIWMQSKQISATLVHWSDVFGFLDHAKLPCFSFKLLPVKLLPKMISPGLAKYMAMCLTTFQCENFQVSNCTEISRPQRPPRSVRAFTLSLICPIRIKLFLRSVSILIRWAGKAGKDPPTDQRPSLNTPHPVPLPLLFWCMFTQLTVTISPPSGLVNILWCPKGNSQR